MFILKEKIFNKTITVRKSNMYKNILLFITLFTATTQCGADKQKFLGHELSQESINFIDSYDVFYESTKKFVTDELPKITPQSKDFLKTEQLENDSRDNPFKTACNIRTLLVFFEILNTATEIIPENIIDKQIILEKKLADIIINNCIGEQYSEWIEMYKNSSNMQKSQIKLIYIILQSFPITEAIELYFNTLAEHEKATDELKPLFEEYKAKIIALYKGALNSLEKITDSNPL